MYPMLSADEELKAKIQALKSQPREEKIKVLTHKGFPSGMNLLLKAIKHTALVNDILQEIHTINNVTVTGKILTQTPTFSYDNAIILAARGNPSILKSLLQLMLTINQKDKTKILKDLNSSKEIKGRNNVTLEEVIHDSYIPTFITEEVIYDSYIPTFITKVKECAGAFSEFLKVLASVDTRKFSDIMDKTWNNGQAKDIVKAIKDKSLDLATQALLLQKRNSAGANLLILTTIADINRDEIIELLLLIEGMDNKIQIFSQKAKNNSNFLESLIVERPHFLEKVFETIFSLSEESKIALFSAIHNTLPFVTRVINNNSLQKLLLCILPMEAPALDRLKQAIFHPNNTNALVQAVFDLDKEHPIRQQVLTQLKLTEYNDLVLTVRNLKTFDPSLLTMEMFMNSYNKNDKLDLLEQAIHFNPEIVPSMLAAIVQLQPKEDGISSEFVGNSLLCQSSNSKTVLQRVLEHEKPNKDVLVALLSAMTTLSIDARKTALSHLTKQDITKIKNMPLPVSSASSLYLLAEIYPDEYQETTKQDILDKVLNTKECPAKNNAISEIFDILTGVSVLGHDDEKFRYLQYELEIFNKNLGRINIAEKMQFWKPDITIPELKKKQQEIIDSLATNNNMDDKHMDGLHAL